MLDGDDWLFDATVLARTDADAADLVTSDIDENDRPFLTGERTVEGFFRARAGIDQGISRGLAYAPHADLLWFETSDPSMEEAQVRALPSLTGV